MTLQQSTNKPSILNSDDDFSNLGKIQKLIQERAYQLFHDRKPDSGDALTDWLKAETQILSNIDLTLKDNEDEVLIEGSLDKFSPEEIEVKAQDGKFLICGMHTEKSSSKKKGVSSTTTTQSNFYKSFSLPDSVDTGKMKVEMKRGKFAAKIPKSPH